MSLLYYTFFGVALVFITYQDFKLREISWWTLPLVLLFSFLSTELAFSDLVEPTLLNLAFVGINLIAITGYFSLKNKKLVNIINTQLGIGDVLFFAMTCFIFGVPSFVLFFVSSLILSVLYVLLFQRKDTTSTIPLAGIMAVSYTHLTLPTIYSV